MAVTGAEPEAAPRAFVVSVGLAEHGWVLARL
jgi:hypothetical protein